jgi:hypothetical protein
MAGKLLGVHAQLRRGGRFPMIRAQHRPKIKKIRTRRSVSGEARTMASGA